MDRMHIMRLFAVALSAGLLFGCHGDTSKKPPIHPNPNMDDQHKLRPFGESVVFEDGRAMQPPPANTLPRGFLQADDKVYRGKEPGTDTWVKDIPIEVDETVLARGEERYNIYCSPCHGTGGHGDGPIPTRAKEKADIAEFVVPTYHDMRLNATPVGSIYDTIVNGKLPRMQPYRHQVTKVEDRWAIVAWVRALQAKEGGGGGMDLTGTPEQQGKKLFEGYCIACHNAGAEKKIGPGFKGLYGKTEALEGGGTVVVDDAYIIESIYEPNAKIVKGYPAAMNSFKGMLNDEQVAHIIAYMKTLK